MRAIVLFILLLLTPTFTFCQTVNDSLDWHRYFPLEVGNEWQYRDAESGPASRFVLRKDTLLSGRLYFIGRETFFAPDGSPQTLLPSRDVYMRYDTSGVVVEFESPDADTGYIPVVFERGLESFPVIDLRTHFGTSVNHPDGMSDQIDVTGGYEMSLRVGLPQVVAAAVKEFATPSWFWSFAADIGFAGGGNLWGPRLMYASVGGVEYGAVFVGTEKVPSREKSKSNLSLYPNPAINALTVSIDVGNCAGCSVIISDAIGRNVHSFPVLSTGVPYFVNVDVSMLAAGLYFVRVQGMVGSLSSAPLSFVVR